MSTNLPRVHQRIFGESADTTTPKRIAQFGSVVAGDPNLTGDIETIQSLPNWLQGWVGSTVTDRRYPTSEETTGVNKVITQQIAYLLQKGIPEWCAECTYFTTSYCQKGGTIYHSLTNNNLNNDPEVDTTNWEIFSGGTSGNYVLKTGDTMSGNLRIENIGPRLLLANTQIDQTTTPATSHNAYVGFRDKDDNQIGVVGSYHSTENNIVTHMVVHRIINNVTLSEDLRIGFFPDGTPFSRSPACDRNHSIVTTEGLGKSSNGYMKLGNGVIIQWGNQTNFGWRTSKSVSFPITFPTACRSIGGSCTYNQVNGDAGSTWYVSSISTTGFTLNSNFEQSSNNTIYWIAVGY